MSSLPPNWMTATSAPGLSVEMSDYLWIVVCGGLASFYMAWGIGANDVANSFATSVGSKTLNLWQACIIAGIFEFLGAILLGGETTKTVASDISNIKLYLQVPEIYMYGMLCSLAVAGSWLLVATYYCMPVSTTHSIIGSIMGFSLVFGSWNGVTWHQETGSFPYTKGFLPVVLSWFFSPICGGILAAIIFFLSRTCILRRQNPAIKAIWFVPILLFITIFINLMFVLAKGAKQDMQKKWPCVSAVGYHNISYSDCSALNNAAAWIAACAAAGCAVIGGAIFIPLLKMKLAKDTAAAEEADMQNSAKPGGDVEDANDKEGLEIAPTPLPEDRVPIYVFPESSPFYMTPVNYSRYFYSVTARQVLRGLFYDPHAIVTTEEEVKDMHGRAEVFDPHAERVFQYLQVFTACCVAFAHGSNDVANAIGPFSGIYTTYRTYQVPTGSAETAKWIFVFGGVGIVLGLMTYGYNIIMQLGCRLLKITPSRGFSAELAAGLTISLASFYGIPVSTTQIIVGCEMGVGLLENVRTGVSWRVFGNTFLGWVWTIILSLGFCAALFSAGAYAPSIIQSNEINTFRTQLYNEASSIYSQLGAINNKLKTNSTYWNGTNTTASYGNGAKLAATLTTNDNNFRRAVYEYSKSQYTGYKKFITTDQALWHVHQAVKLLNQTSGTTIGKI